MYCFDNAPPVPVPCSLFPVPVPPVPDIFIVKTRVADKAHYNVSQLVSSIPTQYKNKLKVKLYRYLFNQDANKAVRCGSKKNLPYP